MKASTVSRSPALKIRCRKNFTGRSVPRTGPVQGPSLRCAEDKERYEKEVEAMPAWKRAKLGHKGTKTAKKGRSTKARIIQSFNASETLTVHALHCTTSANLL